MPLPAFNPMVSFYPNVNPKHGVDTPLRLILAGVQHGRWSDFTRRVRECEYKTPAYEEAKQRMPAFTACGTFLPGTRDLTTVVAMNGLVAMDFDQKENPGRIEWARRQLEADPYTWCCAASVGGLGFFTLVRVSVAADKQDWFDDLREYYKLVYGLNADRGCRDVTRLRFVSHDADLLIKDNASIYVPAPLLPERPRVVSPTALAAARASTDGLDFAFDLEGCVREVERTRTDMTAGNGRWVALAYALTGALGEHGREYFHRLSCFHPHYKPGATDRKYSACLKKPSKVSLGKLIFLMRDHSLEPVRRNSLAA